MTLQYSDTDIVKLAKFCSASFIAFNVSRYACVHLFHVNFIYLINGFSKNNMTQSDCKSNTQKKKKPISASLQGSISFFRLYTKITKNEIKNKNVDVKNK